MPKTVTTTNLKKRDIYVVLSGSTPLHAVYTQRQASRFVAQYSTDDCRLFLGDIRWVKIKLIPPRKFTESEKSRIKEILS